MNKRAFMTVIANQASGPTFAASITPTIGNSIITDGDMESGVVTTWPAVGTPETREKSGTQKHGGSQALHVSGNDATGAQQIPGGASANTWYHFDAWAYVVSGQFNIKGAFAGLTFSKVFTLASWTEVFAADVTINATNPRVQGASYNGAAEWYMDDVYAKPLTTASCFATSTTGGATDTVSAKVTGSAMQKIGVVANLDSITVPANYVLGVVDKESSKAYLYQVSAGVYTQKINTGITYADDKLIEIRHTAPTTYQLWYNGAKVGTDQTINDAAINSNTLYAQFATHGSCSFSSFTLAP